jgi:hypothetical protein
MTDERRSDAVALEHIEHVTLDDVRSTICIEGDCDHGGEDFENCPVWSIECCIDCMEERGAGRDPDLWESVTEWPCDYAPNQESEGAVVCDVQDCSATAAVALRFKGQTGHVHVCRVHEAIDREWCEVVESASLPCPWPCSTVVLFVAAPTALSPLES